MGNLNLESPLASAVAGWVARFKRDFGVIEEAFAGLGASGANLLVNPGFGINQRAQASYTGHGTWSLDRWQISQTGAVSLTVSPDGAIFDALSSASAKCVFALGAGTSAALEQLIEQWATYRGMVVTLRMRVKCSTPNAVRLAIQDGVLASYSAFHSGGGGWETLALTKTLDAAATTLKGSADFRASCTAYLDNATLALGTTPLPFAPLSPAENQARCERYYEIHGGANGFPYVRGYSAAGAGDLAAAAIPWRVKKGGTPTVTKAGTWAVNNAAQPTVPASNEDGYTLQLASLATGYFDTAPNSGSTKIIAEWNAP